MPNKDSAFGRFLGAVGALIQLRVRPKPNLYTKAHADPEKTKVRRGKASESRRRNRAV